MITDDTKTVLLLCGYLGGEKSVKTLTPTEYSRLVEWLRISNLRPSSLLVEKNVTSASDALGFSEERLSLLLRRGVQLGVALEKWTQAGIWVVSRSDQEYPARYRTHLGLSQSPPLLFGVGDSKLLSLGGLGVVGSRNVDSEGADFTTDIGRLCAKGGTAIISGYARGVDQFAMWGALDNGGIAVGILAENLLKKSLEKKAREAIAEKRLMFISHCHPSARFMVGNAMARNKLIYALSDYTLVVNAEYKKGGTWAGATEELRRKKSRPVFVRVDKNVPKGNLKLLEEAKVIQWPDNIESNNLLLQLKNNVILSKNKKVEMPLLAMSDSPEQLNKKEEDSTCLKDEVKTENDQGTIESANSIYKFALHLILQQLDVHQEPKKDCSGIGHYAYTAKCLASASS